MRDRHVRPWAFLCAILVGIVADGDEVVSESPPLVVSGDLPEFARTAFQITELVLDHHVEPPTRQEMLLCGLAAVLGVRSPPQGLSRVVSDVANEDAFVKCLINLWPERAPNVSEVVRYRFLEGLGHAVPGGVYFTSAKEDAVERQLAANQYVGIGVALAKAENSNAVVLAEVFPRGAAGKAGIVDRELLLEVDGVKTEDLPNVVERLRGAEGTTVTVKVAPNAGSEPRLVTLTRSVVPRQTVVGRRQLAPEIWETVIEGVVPAAYLRIDQIAGSTASELREYEAELSAKDIKLLILDLRRTSGRELRHVVAVADTLLDGGSAGIVRTRHGARAVPLERDCLFREWPMAVLVGEHTTSFAEWLAGALQRQRKAIVVGEQTTGGKRFVLTPVALPDNRGVMKLATAILEQEDCATKTSAIRPRFRIDFRPSEADRFHSLLLRMPSSQRTFFDRCHGVTPDVELKSQSSDFGRTRIELPDEDESRLVARAIEALIAPPKELSDLKDEP